MKPMQLLMQLFWLWSKNKRLDTFKVGTDLVGFITELTGEKGNFSWLSVDIADLDLGTTQVSQGEGIRAKENIRFKRSQLGHSQVKGKV